MHTLAPLHPIKLQTKVGDTCITVSFWQITSWYMYDTSGCVCKILSVGTAYA